MKRLSVCLTALLFFVAVACSDADLVGPSESSDNSLAKGKPGGGGGPGGGGPGGGGEPTPAGTIYANIGGETFAMDGDGNNRVGLGMEVSGEPSYNKYLVGGDSVRWFVTLREIGTGCDRYDPAATYCYPDSLSQQEVVAVSSAGTEVVLFSDPLFDPGGPHWAPAPTPDGRLSFTGRRFPDASSEANEGGIYVADVTFTGGVPSLGPPVLEMPTGGWQITECFSNGICRRLLRDASRGHDWSPDGSRFVFSNCDYATTTDSTFVWDGASKQLLYPGGSGPKWSAQDEILLLDYEYCGWATGLMILYTVDPNGGNLTQIDRAKSRDKSVPWTSKVFQYPRWSSTGSHMVYMYRECDYGAICDKIEIVRRQADGGDKTILDTVWWDILRWR